MKIHVKESTMVTPAEATPNVTLWLSHLDLVTHHYHSPLVFFYRPTGAAANFFEPAVLKAALSRVLVQFYPAAGRLNRDEKGRVWIDCNGEGVLFLEAESDGTVEDLGDLTPKPEINLVPTVDYSKGISSYPLILLQITRFKCGGVCIGVANQHNLSDGASYLHFMRSWSEMAHTGRVAAAAPFLDRTVLRARNPPRPQFIHVEYQPPPAIRSPECKSNLDQKTTFSIFKLTREQLHVLRSNCEFNGNRANYSTLEVLGGHVWRCVCRARGLREDQESKVYIATEGRSRLRPPLPAGYYGNVIFTATPMAISGDLQSKPLKFSVDKIHDALARMENDYLKSALDYLELQPDLAALARGPETFKSPNLGITSWVKLGMYDADFGCGRPIFVGLGATPCEGNSFVIPSPANDGSLLYGISLPKEHMKVFEKLLYHNISSRM